MNLELPLAAAVPQDRPFTVQQVVEGARAWLQQLPAVWVEGEISGFKVWPKSGVWYFNLKDRQAQLGCVMFRLEASRAPTRPADGLKVFVHGHLSVNAKRGQMQFVADQILPTSEGGFHAVKLEQARQALARDGLLEPARKRPLPPWPRCVGVVTSPEGAAWRDVVAVVARRWPGCELVLIGARVQGDEAPRELRRALALANRCDRLDVLIVGRGGGSTEDLWAFNDEAVARAVAASRVPTISAVGHETDVTLTDLVADLRAPTPSAAAEKAVPDRGALLARVDARSRHLSPAAGRQVAGADARLARASGRMAAAVERQLARAARLVATATARMEAACATRLAGRRARLDRLAAQLDALSPLRVLERGYSGARNGTGRVLRRTADFPPGAPFRLRVSDGEVPVRAEGA